MSLFDMFKKKPTTALSRPHNLSFENVVDGKLIYTDELIEKARKAFGKKLPKEVCYEDIEKTANWIIDEIILPQTEKN